MTYTKSYACVCPVCKELTVEVICRSDDEGDVFAKTTVGCAACGSVMVIAWKPDLTEIIERGKPKRRRRKLNDNGGE